MKRVIAFSSLVFIVFAVFSVSIVSAIPACGDPDDDQLLFRMSSSKNAHSAMYDQPTGNPVEVCFDDYFQGPYTGGTPHVDNGGNDILRLFAVINSHAEGPSQSTYSNVVYYGDLICELQSNTPTACQIIEGYPGSRIVFLSGQTNAHVDFGTSIYPQVLCCSSPSEPPICNYNGVCDPGETSQNCADCDTEYICGNGIQEPGEECDGADFGGESCEGLGYETGNLDCNPDCTFDETDCSGEGGGGELCPESFELVYSNGTGELPIKYCYHYTDYSGPSEYEKKDICNIDCADAYINHLVDFGHEGYCGWDEFDSECKFYTSNYEQTGCTIEYEEGICAPGGSTMTVTYKWVNASGNYDPVNCPSECGLEECSTEVSCPQAIQLPFIGIFSMIISTLVIFFVYVFYLTKKK
jgi:hypothetical protein